jgi:hypothetical protein
LLNALIVCLAAHERKFFYGHPETSTFRRDPGRAEEGPSPGSE